ncbi:MAG: adenylate/guanylate cyclase domain-containing protein [Saprospiraceae bacterium]
MFRKIATQLNQFLLKIGSIGFAESDSVQLKSYKTIATIAIYATILNLLYFAYEYSAMGRDAAALTLGIFAVLNIINLIVFRITRNFKLFRNNYFNAFYFYLIIYHTVMGGFIGSVVYIFYAIPALVGVQMFYEDKMTKRRWLILYLATSIVLYFLEPIISVGMVPLPERIVLLTFLNNFILITIMVVLAINYYKNQIMEEKRKTDLLIRNILPESVVNELNEKGKSIPILTQSATAIFMDFVGFTAITRNMLPTELVSILNDYFTSFDQIFKEHNVEKLKTIGDGYMAVGGLPIPNKTHTIDVALAALKILMYMEEKNRDRSIPWNIRIGIHTGPMVAGIIGESKFSYDVWGSSVNLASRLESSGKSGAINVSYDFMVSTKDFFDFEDRGLIEIKNVEPTRMYFLLDIKPELKQDHFTPNTQFFEMYNKLRMINH